MNIVTKLAKRRIRHQRSQTILTGIAFVLTACLLMTASTMGLGIYRVEQESAIRSNQNYHAQFSDVTPAQLDALRLHLNVESLTATEIYASVSYEKMNASLRQEEILIPGIRGIPLVEGRFPEGAEDIAGPPAFFERLGYDAPALGDVVEIPHRINGKGEILTRSFTICGLQEQVDMSEYSVADTRIVYSALVSKELADQALAGGERSYRVSVRAAGEDRLRSAQMEALLYAMASDVGLPEESVRINSGYLMWVTDPGVEIIAAVAGICFLIALFAALVIYGIYYVSIITSVQELGKLKALGATKRQMRGMLLREGLMVALISMPVGLLVGYWLAKACLHLAFSLYWPAAAQVEISLFSPMVLLVVIAIILFTALLSMLRPMRLVSKISPMEAVRYQEKESSRKARRKGYAFLNVQRLSAANLSRNRKRTNITIATMALGGILFLAFGGIVSSMNAQDYVRQHLPKGDFRIDLRYERNDLSYPQNNLNALQQTDILGASTVERLLAIPGVAKVEPSHKVLGNIHHPGYQEDTRYDIGTFTREDVARMDATQGSLDYDAMVAENGILLTHGSLADDYGLAMGDSLALTLFDGDTPIPFEGTLYASTRIWDGDLAVPVDLLAKYITDANPTEGLYVWVEGGVEGSAYEAAKAQMQQLVDANTHLQLMSMDEELTIARNSMQAIQIALYLLIAVLGAVSFLNLINTLVTSVIVRRREIGTLQALGLSNRQLQQMLRREGLVFTGGTLLFALTIGNALGFIGFLWAKTTGFMGVSHYHYPLVETVVMIAVLTLGQLIITHFLSRYAHKDSLVQRIQQ